jgi:hypothetical protein
MGPRRNSGRFSPASHERGARAGVRTTPPRKRPRPDVKKLENLVAEAVVDAYDESEQHVGFLTMIQDNLSMPFTTTVLGSEVVVEGVEDSGNAIVAVCRKGRLRQNIPIFDLPLPTPRPRGAEWIDAYRYWLGGTAR